MIHTPKEAQEAPVLAQQQRFGMRSLLRVNEQLGDKHDLALATKVRAVATPDDYDRALADKKVGDLFRRGVLHFGRG
jgi:hypothetical protein